MVVNSIFFNAENVVVRVFCALKLYGKVELLIVNKLVYIAVEVKKRELTAKCLLSVLLVHRGYSVVLANKSEARLLAASNLPGILLDKDYTERRNENWKQIKKNGGSVYAWDEEGIVEVIDQEFIMRTGKSSISTADGIFLWGEAQKDFLNRLGIDTRKLFVVGNPRMDLLGNNISFYYGEQIRKIKQKYGRFILININYCKDDGTTSWLDVIENEIGEKLDEQSSEYINKKAIQYQDLLKLYIEMIKKLSKEYNGFVVVRPHPGERDMDWWTNMFRGFSNVEINRSGDANIWSNASYLMIHPGCTTSMEAYLCRKPSIIYNPISELNVPLLSELSIRADTEEDVIKIVHGYEEGEIRSEDFFSKEKDKMITNHILYEKDSISCDKIIDVLDNNKFDSNQKFEYKRGLKNRIRYFIRRISFRIGMEKLSKFEYTKPREVKQLVESAKAMLGVNTNIHVKEIDANVFWIGRE